MLVSKEGVGISNLNECAPLNEASYWEGAYCLTSVAQGTGVKLSWCQAASMYVGAALPPLTKSGRRC